MYSRGSHHGKNGNFHEKLMEASKLLFTSAKKTNTLMFHGISISSSYRLQAKYALDELSWSLSPTIQYIFVVISIADIREQSKAG